MNECIKISSEIAYVFGQYEYIGTDAYDFPFRTDTIVFDDGFKIIRDEYDSMSYDFYLVCPNGKQYSINNIYRIRDRNGYVIGYVNALIGDKDIFIEP